MHHHMCALAAVFHGLLARGECGSIALLQQVDLRSWWRAVSWHAMLCSMRYLFPPTAWRCVYLCIWVVALSGIVTWGQSQHAACYVDQPSALGLLFLAHVVPCSASASSRREAGMLRDSWFQIISKVVPCTFCNTWTRCMRGAWQVGAPAGSQDPALCSTCVAARPPPLLCTLADWAVCAGTVLLIFKGEVGTGGSQLVVGLAVVVQSPPHHAQAAPLVCLCRWEVLHCDVGDR